MATATATASKFKYSTKHNEYIAKIGKGWTVTEHGYVYDKNGNEVCRIENPVHEVVTIPLKWEVRYEQRQVTVTCQKLSGSHQSGSKAPRIKSSSDGMRTPSTWGSAPAKSVFVADTYEVTVSYTVTVATNNLGDVFEFSPKIPENLNTLTGYGKQAEYTIDTTVTPDLHAEKQEVKQLTREDWLNHYYEKALAKSKKEPAPVSAPATVPTAEWKKGHKLFHPTHGIGEVEKVFATSAMTTLVVKFDCGTKMIDPSTLP